MQLNTVKCSELASDEKQKNLQHILDAHELEEKEKQHLVSLMEKYKTYKDKYMRNIMFDPTNDDLSEYFK